MQNDNPELPGSEASSTVAQTRRRRVPAPVGGKWSLWAFAALAVMYGGVTSALATSLVIQALRGTAPKNADWPLEIGLFLAVVGAAALVAGIGMWRRRPWAWWLMAALISVAIIAMTKGAALQVLCIVIWLWQLRHHFGFAGPFQPLESDIDEIAKRLGIEWSTSPLGRVGELVAAQQDIEAARLYRESFGCDWDEAHAAIARWQIDSVPNKLRHITHVLKSSANG